MGSLRLFAVLEDRRLIYSPYGDKPLRIDKLTSGDRLDIEFTLLKHNSGPDYITTPFELVAAASYSLRIGLFLTADPYTQLAYQTSFSVVSGNDRAREGVLALDTAAISTALTSVENVTTRFEIEASIGSNDHTVYSNPAVILEKAKVPSGTASEQPGAIAATQEWVKNLFVPRDGTGSSTSGIPCDHFLLMGADGVKYQVFSDNGQIHCEPFVPA